ncbi:MAG TPA: hypothetical protein DIU18_06070 [Gemmatimonadetes bacterium]|nr:hypothetical protein [Gemmatimonadota bacterium]
MKAKESIEGRADPLFLPRRSGARSGVEHRGRNHHPPRLGRGLRDGVVVDRPLTHGTDTGVNP